jgi:hypothetical protein
MKTELKHIKTIMLISIFCWASSEAHAQTMTEIYIPIGQSPGVSGKYSIIGKIESVNLKDSTVTILQDAGSKITIKVTPGCYIYLDKSKRKLSNKKGYCADMKPGMRTEAKYKDNKPGNKIEWIKVQLE